MPGLGQILKEIVLGNDDIRISYENMTTDFEKRISSLLSDIKRRNTTVHVNYYMIDDTITDEEDLGGQDEWRRLFFSYFWRDSREEMLQRILDENKN